MVGLRDLKAAGPTLRNETALEVLSMSRAVFLLDDVMDDHNEMVAGD